MLDNLVITCITIKRDEFEIVSEFCYPGDIIGQADGCIDAVTACIGSAWKTFHELSPIFKKHRYISCEPCKNI